MVLEGHKKIGNKLIPPMMQLPNMVFTAFRNDMLPELVWMAPFFLRFDNRIAVKAIIDFLGAFAEVISDENLAPLCFLSNFDKLSNSQKEALIKQLERKPAGIVLRALNHQNFLFNDYPLKFLFGNYSKEISRDMAIASLEEDVASLLDRYSELATKIQVTAVVSMMATGKMRIHQDIDFPDPNLIFTDPSSDGAKKVASFARATLNAGTGFDTVNVKSWPKSFWKQAFKLSGCR